MGARARLVLQASTRRRGTAPPALIVPPASILHKKHVDRIAMHVPRTRTPPPRALRRRGALATPATRDRMGAHAPLVCQASTRRRRATRSAPIVQPARSRQQWRQHPIHVATVRQARSREQTVPLLARIATTEIFKMSQDKPHARGAVPESLQAMTTIPEPHAHIASLVSSNRMQAQPSASHAFLARIRRP